VTEIQTEDFKKWLVRYGLSKGTAKQYAVNVERAYRRKDPLSRLVDDELSPKYLQLIKASLRAWADFTEDDALASDLRRIKLPAALRRKESVPLTEGEWNGLRESIDEAHFITEPMRAHLNMLVCRGFRVADVLRMKRSEAIEGLRRGVLVYEGKGRKRLRFTVADYWRPSLELFADYDSWDRVEDLICPSSKEEAKRSSAAQATSRALKKCGAFVGLDERDVHPHLLRKTYATLYYRRCQDPAKLQAHMQWSDISTAMGYVSAGSVEELDEIAESLF
jgi:integrase